MRGVPTLAWTLLVLSACSSRTVGGDAESSTESSSTESSTTESSTSGSTSADGSESSDSTGSSSTTGDGDGDGDGEMGLCEQSGGTWLPDACGHHDCGVPSPCDAIIPGCDCGFGRTFDPAAGCVDDASCELPEVVALCVNTGGAWDEWSCGHYECGLPPDCEAIIPGCDCGPGKTFDDAAGCADDPACDGGALGDPCDPSADACGAGLACCYPCGIPGCTYECTGAINGECPPPPP